MSAGLHVEDATKVEGRIESPDAPKHQDSQFDRMESPDCPNPGVDSERSQGGPVGDNQDSQFEERLHSSQMGKGPHHPSQFGREHHPSQFGRDHQPSQFFEKSVCDSLTRGLKDLSTPAPDSQLGGNSGVQGERCSGDGDVRHEPFQGKSKQVPVFDGPVAAILSQQPEGPKIESGGAASKYEELVLRAARMVRTRHPEQKTTGTSNTLKKSGNLRYR
jgi:hypothetical protein